MANKRLIPIFDLYENIYDVNNSKYPYTEGQILYATDINKVFKDKGGVRISDIQYYFIDVEDSGDIDDVQLLDQYKTNFLILRGKDKSQKTFFIDENGKAREFESDSLFVIDQVNFYAISAYDKLEKTEIGGKKVYYLLDVDSGEWSSEDIPFKDEKPYKWKKTITTYKNGDVTEEIILVGRTGKEGKPGPGIVFRGKWKPNVSYIGNSVRKDVVEYQESFYYAKEKDSNIGQEPSSQSDYWESFGENFSSVATGLLLTNESYVKNTINVGTNASGDSANIIIDGSSNNPYISIGQEGEGKYGKKGIFLGMDNDKSKLSLQDTSNTNKLSWDGSKLSVVGDLGGQIGKLQIGTAQNGITIDENGIKGVYSKVKDGITEQGTSFELNKNGNAEISGNITALTGSIGGFTISNDVLYNDTSGEPKPGTMNSIWLSGVGQKSNLNIANSNPEGYTITRNWLFTISNNFGITTEGILYAKQAQIDGSLNVDENMTLGEERYSIIPRKRLSFYVDQDEVIYFDDKQWVKSVRYDAKGVRNSIRSSTDWYTYDYFSGSVTIHNTEFQIGAFYSNPGPPFLPTVDSIFEITSAPQPMLFGSVRGDGDGIWTGLGIYSNDHLTLNLNKKNIIGAHAYYFTEDMKKVSDEKIEIGDGDWERVEASSGKDIYFYPYRKAYYGESNPVSVTSLPSLHHYYINGHETNWSTTDELSFRKQLFMLCGTTQSIPANSWVLIDTLINVKVLSVVANTYRANGSSLSNVEGGCQVYWSSTLDVTTIYIGSDVTYATPVSWIIIGYRSLDKYTPN